MQDGIPVTEVDEATDVSVAPSSATSRVSSSTTGSGTSKTSLPPLEELRKKETEEILNYILPPKEWEEDGL